MDIEKEVTYTCKLCKDDVKIIKNLLLNDEPDQTIVFIESLVNSAFHKGKEFIDFDE